MGIAAISNNVAIDKPLPVRGEVQNIDIAVKAEETSGKKEEISSKKEEKSGTQEKLPTKKQIQSAIEQANRQVKNKQTACEFSYHEKTNRISIKVKDKDTDEVIREIPAEEMLDMIEKVWELAGILVDEVR